VRVAMVRSRLRRHVLWPTARGSPASRRAVSLSPGRCALPDTAEAAGRPGLGAGRPWSSVWWT
jgi:hypothetical protein